jgi:hypothetical protein
MTTSRKDLDQARRQALTNAGQRRRFATLLIEDTPLTIDELSDFLLVEDGILRADDISWILDRRAAAPAARRPYWARAARLLVREVRDWQVWDRIIVESATDAGLADEFGYFLGSVALDNPRVQEERARRSRAQERAAARAARGAQAASMIERALTTEEASGHRAWPHVLGALRVAQDGRTAEERFEAPPTEFPGWRNASEPTRARIARSAQRYLEQATPTEATWIGTHTIPGVEVCGYSALRLLVDVDRRWLERQEADFWLRWAAALLGYPAWREDGHRRLVHLLYARAPERVRELIPMVASERDLLDELDPVWDAPLGASLLASLIAGPPERRRLRTIVSRLLTHDDEETERRLVEEAEAAMEGSAQPVYLPELLLLLLTRRPRLWPVLWPRVTADQALALTVARLWAAGDRYEHYSTGVPEAALAELYTFLTRVFSTPRRLPRRRAQQIDAEQELAGFRDSLPYVIAGRGTDAAFTTLADLAAVLPAKADSLREIERRARQQRRTQQWQPLTIGRAREILST